MKSPAIARCAAAAALAFGLFFLSPFAPAFAQNAAQSPAKAFAKSSSAPKITCCADNDELQKLYLGMPQAQKRTPRTADGHPDLSGFWDNLFNDSVDKKADGSFDFELGGPANSPYKWPAPNEPSYKPEYVDKVKKLVDTEYGNSSPLDPQYDCKPLGVPRATAVPLQIVQTPKLIVILYESNNIGQTYRIIYTDGRPHPKDLDTNYLGDSIGHWEGDTLVVDVTGLNDETWLGSAQGHTEPGGPGENGGHQIIERFAVLHSDQEHVTERYTRRGDMLIYNATVEDPVMFTKPWVLTPRHMMLGGPDDRIFESTCVVKDKEHIVKPTDQDHFIPGKSF